ncbi:jupiter microtubule associated homolog 1-like isoform X1 [Ostrinia nubilalis]|uniref:jupiter microtubule associated homolog 1-like isoform X1 n=2 Tax=Ostrinia nubilalis TaxID=29057 RepID=UPI0030825EC8
MTSEADLNRIKMTSTSFNVGLTDNTRLSSRVLRPPGGGHTDIFGGEPEPPRGRRPAPSVVAAAAAAQEELARAANGDAQNGQASEPQEASQPEPKAESPVKPESPAKPDIPKQESAQPEPAKAEPPKRVRVPPGGFSSGLW